MHGFIGLGCIGSDGGHAFVWFWVFIVVAAREEVRLRSEPVVQLGEDRGTRSGGHRRRAFSIAAHSCLLSLAIADIQCRFSLGQCYS